MVEVIWHGHACFELIMGELESWRAGLREGSIATVVLDPFGGIGIPEPKAQADLVLCSHSHRDHNNVDPVLKRGGTVLEGFVGPYTYSQDVAVQGIATFHDVAGGSQRGGNSIYVIQLDSLKLCHLGDLGHDLTAEQIERIGVVDVLFVPVGGGPTIGPDMASLIVEKLKPKIVVPMHYNLALPGITGLLSRLNKVDDFLKGKRNVQRIERRSFLVKRDHLPKEQTIIVPSFK